MLWQIMLGSILCGVVGTGIGGVLGVVVGGRAHKAQTVLLSVSGGLLIGFVCFELLHHAVEEGGLWLSVGVAAFFALLVYCLSNMLTKRNEECGESGHGEEHHHDHGCVVCDTIKVHAGEGLKHAAVILMVALSLHNFPEGMAIGASGFAGEGSWLSAVAIIALHNVPIGMTLAVMLLGGGVKPVNAVFLSLLVGVITLLGAIIGYYLSGTSALLHAVCVSAAAGSMLYITFAELLPQAVLSGDNKTVSVFALLGVLLSMILC